MSVTHFLCSQETKEIIEDIIYSATLAPSAKNRQPWKFIVYQGEEKDKLVDVMRHGINSEKTTHELMLNGHLPYRMLRIQSESCRRLPVS